MPVRHRLTALFAATALALTGALPAASAAPVVHAAAATAASPWGDLHWRLIGPFRAGRTLAVTGVIGQPNHFYMGSVNGGVWKRATPAAPGSRSSMPNRSGRSARSRWRRPTRT